MPARGVLLLAHGTPDSLDDMPEYLTRVRGGRPPSPELLDEIRHNYAAIGGRSPLTDLTGAQAAALQRALGDAVRVYFGMRNWRPYVADALAHARRDGVRELVALPLAPQYSSLSVGKYREAVEAARPGDVSVRFVESWHDHPALAAAFAERVQEGVRRHGPHHVLFTAHSIPARVDREGDPYQAQVRATMDAVARTAGLPAAALPWGLAWQSAGRTPEPWLGPSLEEALKALADEGKRRVLVAPIGFVCDHTEILYDIDVQAAAAARALGIALARTESLNTSETLVRALADVVRASLG